MVALRVDPFPSNEALETLWLKAWESKPSVEFSRVLARSLAHIGAYDDGDELVGFVNVAWDGGVHAFLLDTCVVPACRGQGIATRLVKQAVRIAGDRGAQWIHVDFEPHLTSFYRSCGFRPTEAGLVRLG